MRYIFLSDLHGYFEPAKILLEKINYDSTKDQLVFLGDYIDRGPNSKETIEFVMQHVKDGAIALKGNHDDWFIKWLEGPLGHAYGYFNNGGINAVESFLGSLEGKVFSYDEIISWANEIKEKFQKHIEFLKNLPYYYETNDFIAVHAGINPFLENWKDTNEKDFLWIREPFFNEKINTDKPVIFGHTPTIFLNPKSDDGNENANVYFGENKIGIDGGFCFGHQQNVLIFENGRFSEDNIKSDNFIAQS